MADETKKNWMEELEQFEPDLFWQKHGRRIIWGTVAVLAVFGLGFLWQTKRTEAQEQAAARLAQAADAAALEQLLREYPAAEVTAPALLKLADLQYRDGRYAEAAATYEKLLGSFATHPLAPGARLGLAAVQEAQGNLAAAQTLYQQMIQANPQGYTTPSARMGLARTTELLGQPKQARQLYEEVLAAGPGSAQQQEAFLRWTVLGRELAANPPATNAAAATPPPAGNQP